MSNYESFLPGECEFEFKYVKDGHEYVYTGTAHVTSQYTEASYGDIQVNDRYDLLKPYHTSITTKLELELVKPYKVRTREIRNMTAVTRSVEVPIKAKTFDEVARARKAVNAPKDAKFDFKLSTDSLIRDIYFVVFIWEEEV